MSLNLSFGSYQSSAVSLWNILFRLEGNILIAVLPCCIVNCLLLWWISAIENLGFSPTGHELLTLLVSFLVISKVNLAYDRYKAVRYYAGQGAMVLRELVQMIIVISSTTIINNENDIHDLNNNQQKELRYWRSECVVKCTDIIDSSVRVLQDRNLSKHFARSKPLNDKYGKQLYDDEVILDPLIHIQSLRLHLYCSSDLGFQLLERTNLVTKLNEYTSTYNNLLILSSTPLPFPLVQMGRAFLLIWTFSMPLVLLEGPFNNFWPAQAFLFFLTYGFIGLELVSIKLGDPFGNSRDDVPLKDIRDAMIDGIENDLKQIATQRTISERRLLFSKQKREIQQRQQQKQQQQQQQLQEGRYQHHSDHGDAYHAMTGSNENLHQTHD